MSDTEYYPGKLDHERYLKSGSWKCEKSSTGAHYWMVDSHEMQCKHCLKRKLVDNRSTFQMQREARISANKNKELQR